MALTWSMLTGSTSTAGSIARWVNKTTLSSGAGGDADLILQEATGSIYGKLRHWRMLTEPQTGTMVIGTDAIAVPSDMIEPDLLMITGTSMLTLWQKTPNEVYSRWTYDSSGARVQQIPTVFSFNKSYIQLDSQPDQAYPYILTYYQRPADLSSTNETNFLTDEYPRLIRTAVMMAAAEWTKENNQGQYDRTYWEQQFAAELQMAQQQADRARRGSMEGIVFQGGAATGGWPYPPYAGGYV